MKRIFALTVISLLYGRIAVAQTFDWVRVAGSSISAQGTVIETDADGTSVVGGTFYNNMSLDSTSLFSNGRDIFVTKIGPDNQRAWAKRIGGNADEFIYDLKTDRSGNIYCAGSFAYKITLGTQSLMAAGQQDALIVKLNADGEPIWMRSAGGMNSDFATAIVPDGKGNVYVAGYFHDTLDCHDAKVVAWGAGLMTMFLAKYDADGKCLWVKRLGASNYQSQYEGVGLDVDESGNPIIAGNVHGDAELDTSHFTARGVSDLFVAKFTPAGKLIWKRTAGAPTGVVTARGVRSGPKGSIYVCGYVTNSAQFDERTVITSPLGFSDLYVAKFDREGRFDWVRQGTGRGSKAAESIALDASGNCYITGSFTDTLGFGPVTFSSDGRQVFYAASYTPGGEFRWARTAGRGGLVFSKAIGVDAVGNAYVTGSYNDTVSFGKYTVSAIHGAQDFFLTKLSARSDWSMNKTSGAVPASQEMTSCELEKKSRLTVAFSVVGSQFVKLSLLDMLGNVVESYAEEQLGSGSYAVTVDLSHVPHDTYYCRLQIGDAKHTKRVEF